MFVIIPRFFTSWGKRRRRRRRKRRRRRGGAMEIHQLGCIFSRFFFSCPFIFQDGGGGGGGGFCLREIPAI